MRDEASILPPFLDQATTFFDIVTMVDHASVDSSAALCAARDPERIRVLKLHASGYPQSEVTTLVARMLMAEEQLDALFLLIAMSSCLSRTARLSNGSFASIWRRAPRAC